MPRRFGSVSKSGFPVASLQTPNCLGQPPWLSSQYPKKEAFSPRPRGSPGRKPGTALVRPDGPRRGRMGWMMNEDVDGPNINYHIVYIYI